MCLKGGFSQFNELHPEFCESTVDNQKNPENTAEPNSPVMGIGNLRLENEENAAQNIDNTNPGNRNRPPNLVLEKISHSSTHTSSADSSDTEDSSLSIDDDRDFPVEVLPFLFLGNANNSSDNDSLSRNGISFILNVTSDLPNVFETQGVKYLQIPITDHWSQNLASYFPEAIDFIGKCFFSFIFNQSRRACCRFGTRPSGFVINSEFRAHVNFEYRFSFLIMN